jgi:ketosteroid isomerase-like protein
MTGGWDRPPMTSINTHTLSAGALRRAFDARDAEALTSLYADDATIEIADAGTTPSNPRTIEGREAIRAYNEDVLSRDMTHEVDTVAVQGDSAGFSVRCRYPDGVRVVCVATAQLSDGLIVRQLTAQAWDA